VYQILLTRGNAWDAPVIETHAVRHTIHLVDVERRAQALLNGARQIAGLRPTSYRILDPLGKCVRSSTTAPRAVGWSRGGRTIWH